jgi:hypothetical protein
MKNIHLVAVSCAALVMATAAPALAGSLSATALPLNATLQADAVSDAELRSFAAAMAAVQPIAAAAGGSPSAEQQGQMAAAIEASGLSLARFNAISTAVSSEAVVRARLELATTEPSPPGSTAAGVSDAEVDQFASAMAGVQPIARSLNGAAPTADQQAQMAAAITGSGLSLERFNAISGAVSQDDYLKARLALADVRRAN